VSVLLQPTGTGSRRTGRIFDFELTGEELSRLDALDRTGGTGNALEHKWW